MADNVQPLQIILEYIQKNEGAVLKAVKDIGELEKETEKSARTLDNYNRKTTEAADKTQSLSSQVMVLGRTLATVFAVERIIAFTNAALGASEAMSQIAKQTGLTNQEVEGFQKLAAKANIDAGTFRMGMIELGRAMAESADPASKAAEAFRKMGIGTAQGNASLMTQREVLFGAGAAMEKYAASSQKTALSSAILNDRIGPKFVDFLSQGRTAMEASIATSDRFGANSDDTAEKASELSAKMIELKAAFNGLFLEIGVNILPIFHSVIDSIKAVNTENTVWKALWDTTVIVAQALGAGLVVIGGAIEALLLIFAKSLAAVNVAMYGEFQTAKQIMKDLQTELDALAIKGATQVENIFYPKKRAAPTGATPAPAMEDAKKKADALADAQKKINDQAMADLAVAETEERRVTIAYQENLQRNELLVEQGRITQSKADEEAIAGAQKLALKLGEIYDIKILIAKANPQLPQIERSAQNTERAITPAVIAGSKSKPGDFTQGLADYNKGLIGVNDKTKLWAASLRGVLDPALDSVSDGITGLITGTKSWGAAFANTGLQIISTLVKIGVQMFAQHIISMAIKKTEDAATTKTMLKNSYAAAIGAYKALADIPIVGPILGGIAFGVVLAICLAAAAFKRGGYTGDGNPSEVAGIVHRNEIVIPAPVVSAVGPAHFAKNYFGGHMPGYAGGGYVSALPTVSSAPASSGQGSNMSVKVGMINNRQDQRNFMAGQGWKIFLDQAARRGNSFQT